jgi:hypothetical protein
VLVAGRTVKVTLLLECTTTVAGDAFLAKLPSSLIGKLDTDSLTTNYRPFPFFSGFTQYGCTTPVHGSLTIDGDFYMWTATQGTFYLVDETFILID